MKIVGLEIKKIGIGKFFPKDGKAELCIMFNDGDDKELLKTVDVSDSAGAAENILIDLRKMEKEIHKIYEEGSIMDNFVNVVIKDEDELIKEISGFIQRVGIKIEEINNKKEAEGYINIIRELKNMKLEF